MMMSAAGASAGAPRVTVPPRVPAIIAIACVAVLLQVSVMPFLTVAQGMPDLLVCAVVSIAVFRGALVGAIVGAVAGLSVELLAPVGTLGALGLLYLVVGYALGRLCEREGVREFLPVVLFCVIGECVVQVGELAMQVLLARPLIAGDVAREVLAALILTGFIAVPIHVIIRKVLRAPRVIEPYRMPGDG